MKKNTEEIETLINLWIFSERDRAIAKRKIIDDITHERLAEEFDMSVTQTKRIVYKVKQVLLDKDNTLDI